MRVLLITQGVSRLVEPLFESSHEVVGVIESMPRDYSISFSQPPLFRFFSLVYKFFTPAVLNLKAYCLARKTPYNYLCKGRDAEVARWVADLSPDVIVVFSMSQLLKESLLSLPRLGVINMHPSYLPAYRGPNPAFWQYYDMELNPGVTVHYLDAGEDTGDIVAQRRVPIALGEKSPAVLDTLIGKVGVPLMLDALNAIERGNATRTRQAVSPTPRARNLRTDEHGTIIDWARWPIERVWHVLRGTELWLNAIAQPTGLYIGHRWCVEEFIKIEHLDKEGSLVRFQGRHCVAARGGYIFLSRKFSLKRLIVGILQR
ncbi:methionyl-tRNA formyltransferase [Pseudomonas mosselii]|uniref:methionyl-tRNA formyltransferase n=1 Tax=Pseudomonas mosselii TaxID=78327 RepID=UPI001F4C1065|nr:formyltransferase family protein [Pseudomonas mosselii]MCH7418392.1 hypothetical protein [Pseudomonas mosselii]